MKLSYRIRYQYDSPIGKKMYGVSINDLMDTEFLSQTSLVNCSTYEEFNINLNKRFDKVKSICEDLDINLDYTMGVVMIKASSEFSLIGMIKEKLPHLLINN